jgi:hypothetical protein
VGWIYQFGNKKNLSFIVRGSLGKDVCGRLNWFVKEYEPVPVLETKKSFEIKDQQPISYAS